MSQIRLSPIVTTGLLLLGHAVLICGIAIMLVPQGIQVPSHYSVPDGVDGWSEAWSLYGFMVLIVVALVILIPLVDRLRLCGRRLIQGHPALLLPAIAFVNAILTVFIVRDAISVGRGPIACLLLIPVYFAGVVGATRYLIRSDAWSS